MKVTQIETKNKQINKQNEKKIEIREMKESKE